MAIGSRVHRLIDVTHDDIILRTFILFMQTAYAAHKYADAHLYAKGRLSVIKLIVLKILATNGGSMTPSEIAEWTFKERHNITTLLDRLEKEELVRTERSNRDKRFVNVTLTAKGRKTLNRVMPVAKVVVGQVMSSITEDDAALLEKYLQTLRQNAHGGLQGLAKRVQPKPG